VTSALQVVKSLVLIGEYLLTAGQACCFIYRMPAYSLDGKGCLDVATDLNLCARSDDSRGI